MNIKQLHFGYSARTKVSQETGSYVRNKIFCFQCFNRLILLCTIKCSKVINVKINIIIVLSRCFSLLFDTTCQSFKVQV